MRAEEKKSQTNSFAFAIEQNGKKKKYNCLAHISSIVFACIYVCVRALERERKESELCQGATRQRTRKKKAI
jgi:uncharacterized protein YrzB (UPF0473 family)